MDLCDSKEPTIAQKALRSSENEYTEVGHFFGLSAAHFQGEIGQKNAQLQCARFRSSGELFKRLWALLNRMGPYFRDIGVLVSGGTFIKMFRRLKLAVFSSVQISMNALKPFADPKFGHFLNLEPNSIQTSPNQTKRRPEH